MTIRPGPHHICPRCGEISDPSTVDTDSQMLVCAHCGNRDPYRLLPPVLFLTGPNGSGKTAVYRHLLGVVDEAVLIDQDLLWGMDPSHDDPASEYRTFRTRVLALAMRLGANGRAVLVEGTTVPWQYEALPARPRGHRQHRARLGPEGDDALDGDAVKAEPTCHDSPPGCASWFAPKLGRAHPESRMPFGPRRGSPSRVALRRTLMHVEKTTA